MTAPLGGICPYFGSKRELAPQIVRHFGKRTVLGVLFAGSLSELLAADPCRHEVVSEKNPDVANLIRCLADGGVAELLWTRAAVAPVSETLFREAAGRLSDPWDHPDPRHRDPHRAFDFLLVSWQGPSGLAGTTRQPRFAVRNTTSGGTVAARWRAVAPSIPWWHERLRGVEFRCRDAFRLADELPDEEGVVVYSDSPYFHSSRSAGRYAFDFTPEDHVRLADRLNRFRKAKVLVAYYDSPKLDGLYPGWKKVRLKAPRKLGNVTGGERQSAAAPEVLLLNRE